MTELEQARAHLRRCQQNLATQRQLGRDRFDIPAAVVIAAGHNPYRDEMANVLAALSWVWDAQERAERNARGTVAEPVHSFTIKVLNADIDGVMVPKFLAQE